jgi:endogenous inhibitor of DNA gyrase (YacG/DUF329 family)
MVMNTATLATAIQRDLLRDEPVKKPDGRECHACGRPFMPKPSIANDNTYAFCSARCRQAYDHGWPAYEVAAEQALKRVPFTADSKFRIIAGPPGVTEFNPLKGSNQLSRGIKGRGRTGWLIGCFNCSKEFDSTGLRCCSVECERRYHKRQENERLMGEVGMDRPTKRKCEGCGKDIPNWINGRRTLVTKRFCSSRCKQRSKATNHP